MKALSYRRKSAQRGRIPSASVVAGVLLLTSCYSAFAETDVERGQYLVTIGGCNDCHTRGYFLGNPDQNRFLGGSDVGFFVPNLGAFVGPNLTPDNETGLGTWSKDDIVNALQKGITPDGRELAPVMPWRAFAKLRKSDVYAIAAYLKSLPIVKNQVAGPFGPTQKLSIPVLRVVAPDNAN